MTMRGFIVAVQFLTRLPTPWVADFDPREISRSAVYFPLVGALIGAFIALSAWGLGRVDPWIGALAGLAAWVLITGGLHLDGLGDVADALGASHRNPERFFEVLRDPHVGAFGVIAITLQMAAKLVLLAVFLGSALPWAVILVPAWARWGALVWARAVPPLASGMGERFSWEIGWTAIAAWGIALMAASAWAAPPLLAMILIAPLIAIYWRWRIGGVTGDCLGASVEVAESCLLLALVAGKA